MNNEKYWKDYSGGIEDVKETFNLFAEVVEKSIVPDIPIPEIKRLKAVFPADPSLLLNRVRSSIFDSNDAEEINKTETTLRKLRDDLEVLANDATDDLECSLLYTLRKCADKIAALLTYKRVVIGLEKSIKQ